MALLQSAFSRLSLSNAFLPYKCCYNRLSTTLPLSKLSVEEKLGIKPPPKRPKTSFLRFLSQIKPQIIKDNPNITVTGINRIAGEKWRNIDEKTKAQLSQEFKTDWIKYLDNLKAYEDSLSPTEKKEIQKANDDLLKNKKKKKIKVKSEELGKPKKPPGPFILYMQSKIHERGTTPFRDWLMSLKKEWEGLPADVTEKFQDKFHGLLDKYKLDIEKWEKKMKREGHKELVRTSRS